MPIIYNKMLKRLDEKGITSYTVKRDGIIGQATFRKIKEGGDIDTRTIAKMCEVLECQPGDLLEYVPDEDAAGGYQEVITEDDESPQYPNTYKTIELTEEDRQSAWSAVWSTVLRDAPVFAFEDKDSDNVWDGDEAITAYYVYTVEEPEVPNGYEAIVDNYDPTDAGDYELTVTNKRSIPLPDTGAGGDAMFVAVGVGLLLLGLTLTRRRRPRKGER